MTNPSQKIRSLGAEADTDPASEKAFRKAVASGAIPADARLFLTDDALLGIFMAGYRAGMLSMTQATPGHNPALAMRNEAAEQFVIECVRQAPPGANTKMPNSALKAAFSAWLAKHWPNEAALIEARGCARALHRAMDERGLGERPVHGTASALRYKIQLVPGIALDAAISAQQDNGRTWADRLAMPVAMWVDDHVLAYRDPHEAGALHTANSTIAFAFTMAMHRDFPAAEQATQHAIIRAVNKRLDEEGVGEPSRNAAGLGRRGLYIVPDGKTVADLIDERGREWVERMFVLRGH